MTHLTPDPSRRTVTVTYEDGTNHAIHVPTLIHEKHGIADADVVLECRRMMANIEGYFLALLDQGELDAAGFVWATIFGQADSLTQTLVKGMPKVRHLLEHGTPPDKLT